MSYDLGTTTLTVDLEQVGTSNTWHWEDNTIDFPAWMGGSSDMWFGFTGATGGENADQRISELNFTFPGATRVLELPDTAVSVVANATVEMVADSVELGGLAASNIAAWGLR